MLKIRRMRASKSFTLFVLCVATFTDNLMYGLILPVLPFALVEHIGLPDHEVQKWTSVLMGTFGGSIALGSVLFGYLGDCTTSRRLPFMFGLALLGASTLAFAAARSLVILVIARCLQGLASSIPSTVGVALLYDKVGQEHIGEALGWTAFSITIAFFIGPLIGGLLYQYVGYHAVFVPVYALVVIEIGLRALVIEERHIEERNTCKTHLIDPERDGRSKSYGATKASDDCKRYDGAPIVAKRLDSPTAQHPVLTLLSERRMLLSMMGLMLLSSINGVFESVLPYYCHKVFDLGPSLTAAVFVPQSIPILFSPWIGKLVDSNGPRRFAVAAFGLSVFAFIMMGFAVKQSIADVLLMISGLVCFGFSSAAILPALMSEITISIEDVQNRNPGIFGPSGAFSLGYGLNHCVLSLGIFIGAGYGGIIHELFGWSTLMFTIATLCFFTMISL